MRRIRATWLALGGAMLIVALSVSSAFGADPGPDAAGTDDQERSNIAAALARTAGDRQLNDLDADDDEEEPEEEPSDEPSEAPASDPPATEQSADEDSEADAPAPEPEPEPQPEPDDESDGGDSEGSGD